jgi:hypothetical protein
VYNVKVIQFIIVQTKKFCRGTVMPEEKFQKCNQCKYFCKHFILVETVSELQMCTANRLEGNVAWVNESSL